MIGNAAIIAFMFRETAFRMAVLALENTTDKLDAFFAVQRHLRDDTAKAAKVDLCVRPHIRDMDIRSLLFQSASQQIIEQSVHPGLFTGCTGVQAVMGIPNTEALLIISRTVPVARYD